MTHTESTPTVRYVVVFGEYEDEYSIGEFATEDEALIAAARHCLQYCVGQRRMPDPFRIDVER
jgi:hypothetical protein